LYCCTIAWLPQQRRTIARTSNLLVATTCTAVARAVRATRLLLLLARVAGTRAPLLDERRMAICDAKVSRSAGLEQYITGFCQSHI
jgi:hypothetical protein